ncbi:head GIN domain-containing protein [Cellulophaga baltica]|uniref:Chaperonin n=1 Tax=Cellulophaga baltica 18 TaxID=1348584 RepID=A0AAU8RG35_9FLAO|nr:head GIN domain-containing protein [Cellulophaga baltica]AIZ41563.1 chaperonin [Cellulophaga baltica 18]
MKNLILAAFFLVTLSALSQRTLDRDMGDFHEVKVFDLIEVNLIKSEENKVLIKGKNVDDIKLVNNNGVLKIRMELDKKFHGEDTFVEVYYTDLSLIDGNEGARITSNATIEQNTIELKTQEGALIKVGLDVDVLIVRAVTGGIVDASGMAKNQQIVLNTGGIFEGKELRAETATVKITAAGEADVYASKKVDIKIKAGGDVTVYGNPEYVNKNTFAGGRVRIIE